jgi:Transglycosylase SLT domain
LKKYLNTDDPLKVLSEIVNLLRHSVVSCLKKPGSQGMCKLRKVVFTVSFLLAGLRVVAPETNSLIISESSGVQPFSDLMYATAMVETMGNTLAYNELENAVGLYQIRQVRIDEYNRRTGSNYTLSDMFDPELSARVYLYFASLAGPYNLERIARAWNGSGPMTELYWKRIKEYL